MKSYLTDSTPLLLLKEAIDIFHQGEVTHHRLMLGTHSLGFQGAKRWHRVQSGEDRRHCLEVQNYVIDMFGDILTADSMATIEFPKDYKEYLESYLDWEIYVYNNITRISNQLMVNNYNEESKLVSKCLGGVRKEIEKVRRWLQDYELVKGDMAYIRMKDNELHEKVKKLENE